MSWPGIFYRVAFALAVIGANCLMMAFIQTLGEYPMCAPPLVQIGLVNVLSAVDAVALGGFVAEWPEGGES